MFENLSDRLGRTLKTLRGQGRLSEENIKDSLREVRMALLEADVALPVVRDFINHVKERAVGEEVHKSLSPGQALIKIVNDELTVLMGAQCEELDLAARPPAVVLMAGLQGSGKTTFSGKLASHLKNKQGKTPFLVAGDVYRPAAIDQLKVIGEQISVPVYTEEGNKNPVKIAKAAIKEAKMKGFNTVIIDTAGRLHIDAEMMDEIRRVHDAVNPVETLFVVDSMTGQDAANTAKTFNEVLPLSGVILTKADGDARGGAALSIRAITGKPIKFIGVGEKTAALEAFYPDRIASRILGMGDILSLVEEAEHKVDKEQVEKLARKITRGKGFDMNDFRDQLDQMLSMGGLAGLMDKMPGMGQMPKNAMMDDSQVHRMKAIINSMTPHERSFPAVIKGSRRRRIAAGSGTQVQDVNRLLKQHMQMQKMMKKMSKGGMGKMMRGMKGKLPQGGQGFPFQ